MQIFIFTSSPRRWNRQRIPKRRQSSNGRRGYTQKNTYKNHLSDFRKFGIGVVVKNLQSQLEFRENFINERRCPMFYIFARLGYNSVRGKSKNVPSLIIRLVQIGALKVNLSLIGVNEFLLVLSTFLL